MKKIMRKPVYFSIHSGASKNAISIFIRFRRKNIIAISLINCIKKLYEYEELEEKGVVI